MGNYYDKLRDQRGEYDNFYNYDYSDYSRSKKQKHDAPIINVNVDCCDHKKDEKKENVRSSAFRAVKAANQIVAANTVVKVLYPIEQFDLANEYNAGLSTFIPATRGVYSIIASVRFAPNNTVNPYRALLIIAVNGVQVAADNDFFSTIFFSNVITVTTDIQLNAGDRVEVFFQSSAAGQIIADATSSRFEAARFPSPAH